MKFKNKNFCNKSFAIKNSGQFEEAVKSIISANPEQAREIREAYPMFEEHLLAEGVLEDMGNIYRIDEVEINQNSMIVKVINELSKVVGKKVRLFIEVEDEEEES